MRQLRAVKQFLCRCGRHLCRRGGPVRLVESIRHGPPAEGADHQILRRDFDSREPRCTDSWTVMDQDILAHPDCGLLGVWIAVLALQSLFSLRALDGYSLGEICEAEGDGICLTVR